MLKKQRTVERQGWKHRPLVITGDERVASTKELEVKMQRSGQIQAIFWKKRPKERSRIRDESKISYLTKSSLTDKWMLKRKQVWSDLEHAKLGAS